MSLSNINGRLRYDSKILPHNKYAGSVKVLLSLCDFLNTCMRVGCNKIIFVGGAPFNYGEFVEQLYPEVSIIIFDSRNLSYNGRKMITVHSIEEYLAYAPQHDERPYVHVKLEFTDEHCKLFDSTFGFFNDKRSSRNDSGVIIDNFNSMNWVRSIKPAAYGVKFRCAFNQKECFEYLGGEFKVEPYSNNTSAETRLIGTDPLSTQIVDPDEYCEKMFYYNVTLRKDHEKNIVRSILGHNKHMLPCIMHRLSR